MTAHGDAQSSPENQTGLVIAIPTSWRLREAEQSAQGPHLGRKGGIGFWIPSPGLSPAQLSIKAGEVGVGKPHLCVGGLDSG